MNIKCLSGLHTWDGCICSVCGKVRDKYHDWSNDCEICSKCHKTVKNQHDWKNDCEKCSKCGKTRENEHNLSSDCEKCWICGKVTGNSHVWDGCVCKKCGKTKSATEEGHNWSGCKCLKCGTIHETGHNYVGMICSICGKEMKEGSFIDDRDGHIYKWVKIGSKIVMQENLAYRPATGNYWTYGNNESETDKYGYLYDWETANKISPQGWHLPSKEEWETLLYSNTNAGNVNWYYSTVNRSKIPVMLNLSLGCYHYTGGTFRYELSDRFWSASSNGESEAWVFFCNAFNSTSGLGSWLRECGFSVRLFQDT